MVVSSRSMNHPDFTLLFWKKTSTPTHTVETPANLSQKAGLWMVDASVPEGNRLFPQCEIGLLQNQITLGVLSLVAAPLGVEFENSRE